MFDLRKLDFSGRVLIECREAARIKIKIFNRFQIGFAWYELAAIEKLLNVGGDSGRKR